MQFAGFVLVDHNGRQGEVGGLATPMYKLTDARTKSAIPAAIKMLGIYFWQIA
jgi:hypothetical protein